MLAGGLGFAANALPLKSLEWMTEGLRLQLRAKVEGVPPTGEVVLIGVDVRSVHELGRWPFPRSYHGQLMDWLGRGEKTRPSVLGWDILFTEEDLNPGMDSLLVEPTVRKDYPVVMGAQFDEAAAGLMVVTGGRPALVPPRLTAPLAKAEGALKRLPDRVGGQLPIPLLLESTSFAFLNADADSDGVVRRFPLVVRVGDNVYPSLVLDLMMKHLHVGAAQVEIIPGVAVVIHENGGGERRIPVDKAGYFTLNYRYELRSEKFPNGIDEISYVVLHETLLKQVEFGEKGEAPATGGKIAIVGQTAVGLSDIGPSPLNGQSAKVLVHINALENILRGDYLRPVSRWPGLVVILLLGLGAAWVLEVRRSIYVILIPVLAVAFAAVAWLLLVWGNWMVPLAVPLVAFAVQQAAVTMLKIREEQAQRDRIRRMFGSYVSPELVRRMVDARVEPQLGGHEDEISAFFSDIQGFSAFSEVLSPADLVVLLNEYLGAMTDILQDSGGALDKYIGDAIVAMFGGLVPLPDHARRACEATAKMQLRQAELRAKWTAQGDRWPPLVHAMRTRIGINSGSVVVGNMGSSHRFNYTMMGDTVNLAARCESGAKSFGAYAVATGATVTAAKAAGCECVFRLLDRIVVKGRTEPVEIFEIVALSPAHLPEGAVRCLELFEKGRMHYLQQEWDAATQCFEEAIPLEPLQVERDAGVEANPSLLMRARCIGLKAHPPGAAWDGVYRMTSK
ncbi:CHASE2 domain-containing protein [Rariglobus hedericola]|uniref:CHASE2 domain-containing protein n=1 Tax=Rariglobus hedericola TaxID=2597822 RepID=UPI0023B122BF|nr:adenylate/guanylate cyclase domain-containing protein [Rariglobus hedericola]